MTTHLQMSHLTPWADSLASPSSTHLCVSLYCEAGSQQSVSTPPLNIMNCVNIHHQQQTSSLSPVILGRFSVISLGLMCGEGECFESIAMSRDGVNDWFREDPELFLDDPEPLPEDLFFLYVNLFFKVDVAEEGS